RKRSGLAGAGLREAYEIAPLEHDRDGLGLDRGRRFVTLGGKRLEDRRRDAEVFKLSHNDTFEPSRAIAWAQNSGTKRRRRKAASGTFRLCSKPKFGGGVPGGPRSQTAQKRHANGR